MNFKPNDKVILLTNRILKGYVIKSAHAHYYQIQLDNGNIVNVGDRFLEINIESMRDVKISKLLDSL